MWTSAEVSICPVLQVGNLRDPTQIYQKCKTMQKELIGRDSVSNVIRRQINDGDNMHWQEGEVPVDLFLF